MANPKTIENVLNTVALPENGKERLKAFYEDRQELGVATEVNLRDLRESINGLDSLDAKIVALIIQISGLDAAKSTPAWGEGLSDQERNFFENANSHAGHIHNNVPPPPRPGIAGPSPLPEDFVGPVGHDTLSTPASSDLEHNPEATSVLIEIEQIRNEPAIASNPYLQTRLDELEKKVRDGVSIPEIRIILSQMREGIDVPVGPDSMQGIIDILKNFELTDVKTMPEEAKITLFSLLVKKIYDFGGSLVFQSNDSFQKTGQLELDNYLSTCQKFTKDWLKKGLILNSSQAGTFMQSMGSDSSKLTVETFVSQYGGPLQTSQSPIDRDILASCASGGYDIVENDILKRRGFNIGKTMQTGQDALNNWKKIGIVSPMRKAGGAGVQFVDMAYNVVRVGFVVGTAWKGTKAIWKTIFGDEASMKAAWGDFGKTAAWTAGIWYGGEAVKRAANGLADRAQNGEFEPIMAAASPHHSENMWAIWDLVGGGIVPERPTVGNFFEGFASSTVDWYVFRSLMTDFFMDQSGGLAKIPIQKLADAIEYKDHTPYGESHVGGIHALLREAFGPRKGEEMYLRYFGKAKEAKQSYAILRAIVAYRLEGPNAIGPRTRPVWDLFATELQHEPEVPANFDDEMKDVREAWGKTGRAAVELGLVSIAFVGDMVHLGIEGVKSIVEFPMEKWETLTAAQKANVVAGIRTVGLATATGLLFTFGPGGWVGVALKGVATAATGWSLFDNFKGSINIDTGEVLSGVRGVFQQIYNLPFGIPDNIKTLIQPYLDPNVPLTETAARQLIAELKANVTNPAGVALIGLLEGLLPDVPTTVPSVPLQPVAPNTAPGTPPQPVAPNTAPGMPPRRILPPPPDAD